MSGERVERDRVRLRLVDLAGHGPRAQAPGAQVPGLRGWVPAPPVASTASAASTGHAPQASTSAEIRSRAIDSAVAAYTAAHGHPLEGGDGRSGSVRWATPIRTAVAAVLVLVLLTGVVAVRSMVRAPAPTTALGERPAVADPSGSAGEAPADEPGAADGAGSPESGSGADEPSATSAVVVVHVVGQVERPGVVELPVGSRVADALLAAGGATPGADASALNLARVLTDGEQIHVPAPGEVVVAPEQGHAEGAPAGEAGGTVNLNTADAAALESLPGIGPVLARRILDHRGDRPFTSVEELAEVSGIGPALLAGLRDLVSV